MTHSFPTRRSSDLPFSVVSEVRKFFDGPVILAGGISNGRSLAAARVLGADMVAAGTGFIAATESAAPDAYREILIESGGDDIVLTSEVRSEEHTSELQSLMRISYAVFCLQQKNKKQK